MGHLSSLQLKCEETKEAYALSRPDCPGIKDPGKAISGTRETHQVELHRSSEPVTSRCRTGHKETPTGSTIEYTRGQRPCWRIGPVEGRTGTERKPELAEKSRSHASLCSRGPRKRSVWVSSVTWRIRWRVGGV